MNQIRAAAAISVLAALLITACGTASADDTEAEHEAMREACRDWILDQLTSPGSAQFGEMELTEKTREIWNEDMTERLTFTHTVSSWVDSQNSFGALVRTNFGCDMRYDPETGKGDAIWRITDDK
ncbi:hypothetical protein [Rhodococcus rhodnii]|uniref:Lipoprotein n=2 Tax=Rhodococcus rhodnii TaxID=38312 RepID=R7WR49_9NOCA|nr:hypothetical protein [Rhodococcus rhodnii]EOM77770.1 hypothetical protein Rrhod_0838 [Rhodococcus rhodnii LMG 5362]